MYITVDFPTEDVGVVIERVTIVEREGVEHRVVGGSTDSSDCTVPVERGHRRILRLVL